MARVDASFVHHLLYTAKECNTHTRVVPTYTHLSRRYIFWPQTFMIFGQEVGFCIFYIYCIVCFGDIYIRSSQKFLFFLQLHACTVSMSCVFCMLAFVWFVHLVIFQTSASIVLVKCKAAVWENHNLLTIKTVI